MMPTGTECRDDRRGNEKNQDAVPRKDDPLVMTGIEVSRQFAQASTIGRTNDHKVGGIDKCKQAKKTRAADDGAGPLETDQPREP